MHQNGVALHAANGMLDKNADLTQGFLGGLLLITQLRAGVLLTLARLLHRNVNPIAAVVRSNATGASVNPNIAICQPIQIRGELLFQHEVVVIVTAKGPPKKDNKLVRQRHNRVLQRMLFFFPL